MKSMNRYKLFAIAFGLIAMTSCDFEEINTNPFEMTDEEGLMDGYAIGGLVTSMEKSVFPTGTQADDTDPVNQYQLAYNLSADAWSGYMGINNTFEGGNCHLNYVMVDGWLSSTFRNSYTNLLDSWKKLTAYAKQYDAPEIAALAQLLKISGWHKVLESFGPIPYSQAGSGEINVPYDSEKDVYKGMLKDLEDAVTTLTPMAKAGVKVLGDYDLVYEGNTTKWVKYANSLMLRLAMRLREARDPEMQQWSKEYAKKAVTHEIGVMSDVMDAAGAGTGAGVSLRNPMFWISENYNDARVGTTILSYLTGYNDPRLSAYCLPVHSECTAGVKAFDGKKYQGVPMGHQFTRSDEKTEDKAAYYYYSKPNLQASTTLYWMRTSEVLFLRAEAALFWGGEFGNAESLYKEGIAMSFAENGVQGNVDTYVNSNKVPAATVNDAPKYGFSCVAPCQTTAKFSGSNESKLEKIMIQKYIAMYPNGQEAWTEFRRTGYPKLNSIVPGGNHNTSNISNERGIRRMIYPVSFKNTDATKELYNDAVQKLGGPDKESTDLIWAKQN